MKKMFGLVLLLVASSAFAGPTCTKEDKAKWQDQKKLMGTKLKNSKSQMEIAMKSTAGTKKARK